MNPDGSAPAQLTTDAATDGYPDWSPDGPRLAFASYRTGDWEIWTMDPDGGNLVNVTRSPATDDRNPAWSPDGSRLAFVWGAHVTAAGRIVVLDLEVFVMDADGSSPNAVTAVGHYDAWPDWQPLGPWWAIPASGWTRRSL